MAIAPLFVANYATLKARLRLSGVPDDSSNVDASAMIDEAVQRARVRFYRELSATRIAQIVAITETDTPTTEDGVIRLCASQCEVKIVYVDLLQRLRSFFADNSAATELAFQTEAILRDANNDDFMQRLNMFNSEIEADMDLLRGTTELSEEETCRVTTYESDESPAAPGESIFGSF